MNPPKPPSSFSSSAAETAAPFLFSPIPRDPTQLLFVDDGATISSRSRTTPDGGRNDSFFDPDVEEMTGLQRASTISTPTRGQAATTISSGSSLAVRDGASARLAKRPRLESESTAIVKSELLATEVESLRLQLDHRTQNHQIQLKERDQQINQLRRQLQYALAEEEHTRAELKSLTTEYANEKLQLQKKAVELESKLHFVEDSFAEWREKADDTISGLQAAARKSKLTIQLLNDEIESLKHKAAPPPPAEYSALESKIKLLETSLRDKELQVQAADERIQNASQTLESSKDVRALNKRIAELESQERRLKQELVELIASSRNSAVHDEKLAQMRQKLQASEQRYAQAQQEIVQLNLRQQALAELKEFFEPIIKQQDGPSGALDDALSTAIINAYKALHASATTLQDDNRRLEHQLARAQLAVKDAQESESTSRRTLEAAQRVVEELQQKVAAASRAFSPMQRSNEELVALLQSYKSPEDAVTHDELVPRLGQLEAIIKEAAPLVKQLEALSTTISVSTPFVAKAHEEEVEALKEKLKASESDAKKLAQQLELTERECAALEKRLGRGEFNPETTKVVHMSVNPTSELLGMSEQASEIESLREEIARLRSQLGGAAAPVATAPTTPAAITTPAAKLTTMTSYETVEGQKLLNQRLKQVFQNQIKQYREAVFQLTGYKVEMRKSNGVEILTLRSMYADHDEDELVVRMETDGSLDLLESDFSRQINKRVFAYLTTCRSFPAFLSTLTLHLFEKQTFQGT